MKFFEAATCGRPMRPKNVKSEFNPPVFWCSYIFSHVDSRFTTTDQLYIEAKKALMNAFMHGEWEVEEEKVTITFDQLLKVLKDDSGPTWNVNNIWKQLKDMVNG